jgi:fimbrial chaperone protein
MFKIPRSPFLKKLHAMSVFKRIVPVFAALCMALGTANTAHAMTVQPVVVDLKPGGRTMSATVSVQNTFTAPLPVELTAATLKFDEAGAHIDGPDKGDLLIFPPQALIPPGQTQSFRIQWVGDPELAQSRHYYVTVAQLPVKLPDGQSAIQILYNFQVLVNVSSTNGKALLTIAKTDIVVADLKPSDPKAPAQKTPQAVVWVQNAGPNYGYLSHATLSITESDTSGKEIFSKKLLPQEIQQTVGFGVIGPNTTRRVVLPIALPSPTGTVKVELTDVGDQP